MSLDLADPPHKRGIIMATVSSGSGMSEWGNTRQLLRQGPGVRVLLHPSSREWWGGQWTGVLVLAPPRPPAGPLGEW